MSSNTTIGTNPDHDEEHVVHRIAATYQALLDLDSDAILIVRTSAGIVQEANKQCCEMLGYLKTELSGISFSDITGEIPLDFALAETIDANHNLLPFLKESMWRHKDGHEIPVRVSMKKIEASGEPFFIIIARDIRELKEKEKALIASEERYHDLVKNSGEGLGVVDTNEIFTFANPAACEIFGFPSEQLIGRSLTSFLDPKAIEEIERQTSLRKQGQKSIYEIEITRPNGERRWIIVTATPQFDAGRNFVSTLGIFRDITERKLAETKIRESERRLHQIVDLTNDWIWEINPEWKYSFVSPKVFNILGYLPEDLIGKSPFDFILPEDVAKVKDGVRNLVHQFKPLNAIVNRAIHKNGHIVYLETSGIAIFDEQATYKGYRGADRDITLRKLFEQELIVAKEKAEESDRLKTSILANMSHELRTPLNGILGFAEILKEELGKSEFEGMVDNIYESGRRLMTTLNSIITLSQLEAGNILVSRKMTMLRPCIVSVVESMSALSSEKNIYVNTSGIRPYSINTDAQLFNQLLQQILDNAIKFTDHGGITIETDEVTESGKDWVVVKIRDTGIGIEKAYYTLIFQEFRQVSEGFGRKYQGSGIGLTISKKIIDLLSGRITIESEPAVGSCFSIWLPYNHESESMPGKSTISRIAVSDQHHAASSATLPTVLLVEDNKVNKELTILFLRNICLVDYAPDATTAIEMTRARQYDAILMDIHLGYGMNGIEATREIRQVPGYKFTPIIAVTGYTMNEDKEQLYAAGCTNHISKPFDKKTLLKLVQEVLHGNNPEPH